MEATSLSIFSEGSHTQNESSSQKDSSALSQQLVNLKVSQTRDKVTSKDTSMQSQMEELSPVQEQGHHNASASDENLTDD